MPSGRRALRWALAAVIVLVIVAVVVYQSLTFINQPKQRRGRFLDAGGAQPVGVAKIGHGDIHVLIRALGTVTPMTTVTVQTQISGQLTEVGFKEGQMVKKGQFLAQIDPRPYEVALQQYQAQLAHDQAALNQAQMDLARYQILAQQLSIARQTAEDQVWTVKQDEGTVALDQAQIRAQQLNLTYCHIVAPADGRVGLRLVDPGNYVQAGSSTGIVVLTLLNPISVLFSVPEDVLPQIQARLNDTAALPITAFDRANLKQLAAGEFSSLDNEIDTTTGTVKLRAKFDNAGGALFPNQFVNVQMLLDTLKEVVVVPASAVQRGAPGTYVYLVNQDNSVSVHTVRLGTQDGDLIAVESGLSPGDVVVTDGADRLRDGAHVSIPGQQPAAPAAAAQDPSAAHGEHHHHHHQQDQPPPQKPGDGPPPADGAAAAEPPADASEEHPHRHRHRQDQQQEQKKPGDSPE
jgi:multidrug efflux system membrane fusion protein